MGSLHNCLDERRYNQFVYLVKLGANVDEVDDDLRSPLIKVCHIANQTISVKLLKLLLRHGADPDNRDEEGLTIIHIACKMNKPMLLRAILNIQAAVALSDTDMYGNSAMHYAASHRCTELMDILIPHCHRYRVCMDERNKLGFTPLLIAASNGHLDMARLIAREFKVSTAIYDSLYFKTPKEWLKMHFDWPDKDNVLLDTVPVYTPKHESIVKVEKLNLIPVTTTPSPNDLLDSYSRKLTSANFTNRPASASTISTIAITKTRPKTAPSGRLSLQKSKVDYSRFREKRSGVKTRSDCGDYRAIMENTHKLNTVYHHADHDCWSTVKEMNNLTCVYLSPTYRKTVTPTWPKQEPTIDPLIKFIKGKTESGRAVSSLLNSMVRGKKGSISGENQSDLGLEDRGTMMKMKLLKLGIKRSAERDNSHSSSDVSITDETTMNVARKFSKFRSVKSPETPSDGGTMKLSLLNRVLAGRKSLNKPASPSPATSPISST